MALQRMADEEERKKMIKMIAVPVVAMIILVTMLQYVATKPLAALREYFLGSDYDLLEDFIDEYGRELGFYGEYGYLFNFDYELGNYEDYDAFDADMFARLMDEATQYIGYPYVWGGSNPATSFDCSGFIFWTYRAADVFDFKRTTAQGIYNQTVKLPRSEAQAGDLVFFHSTYNTGDSRIVTHVGIYLGDGVMLHAGSPIGYANIDSAYWAKYLYAFGRVPVNPVEPDFQEGQGNQEDQDIVKQV